MMIRTWSLHAAALLITAICIALGSTADAKDKLLRGVPTEEEVKKGLSPTRGISPEDRRQPQEKPSISMEVLFALDSTDLTPRARDQLDVVARVLSSDDFRKAQILVEGHTDASGSDTYNMSLSKRRAETVRDYLAAQKGVDPARLAAVGRGERQLYSPDDPYAADNRRVRFVNEGDTAGR